jgi:hypothetical protein
MTYITTSIDGNTLSSGFRIDQISDGKFLIMHWQKSSDHDHIPECIVNGCHALATRGTRANLARHNKYFNRFYIVPMCDKHGMTRNLVFRSKPLFRLVEENYLNTAGHLKQEPVSQPNEKKPAHRIFSMMDTASQLFGALFILITIGLVIEAYYPY